MFGLVALFVWLLKKTKHFYVVQRSVDLDVTSAQRQQESRFSTFRSALNAALPENRTEVCISYILSLSTSPHQGYEFLELLFFKTNNDAYLTE